MSSLYWIIAILGILGAFWWIWNRVVKEQRATLRKKYIKENPELRDDILRRTMLFSIFFMFALFLSGVIVLAVFLILRYSGSPTASFNMVYISAALVLVGGIGTIFQISKYIKTRRM